MHFIFKPGFSAKVLWCTLVVVKKGVLELNRCITSVVLSVNRISFACKRHYHLTFEPQYLDIELLILSVYLKNVNVKLQPHLILAIRYVQLSIQPVLYFYSIKWVSHY